MRDLKLSILSLASLPVLLLGTANAQTVDPTGFQPRNDAGLGSIKRSFNATALSREPGITSSCANFTACALTAAIWYKGRFWVFGREGWCCSSGGPETWVYEWTGDGQFISSRDLPIPVDTDDEVPAGGFGAHSNSSPEVRDLATDEVVGGDTVLLGSEEGIHVLRYNLALSKWELTDQIVTANSAAMGTTATIPSNPIRGEGLAELRTLGTPELPKLPGVSPPINEEGEGYMAVAYDPNGNNGDGSFYVGADFGTQGHGQTGPPFQSGSVGSLLPYFDANGDRVNYSWLQRAQPNTPFNELHRDSTHWVEINRSVSPILEIDLEGNILRTLVNNPITDPLDVEDLDNDGDTAEANPFLGQARGGWWCAGGITIDPITGNLWVGVDMEERILEVDVATGIPTGLSFPQPEIGFLPARQGGLTGIPQGDPGSYPSFWDMIPFTNVAGDDFFTVVRMHQYPGLDGTTEAFLEGSINSVPLSGKIFEPTVKPPVAYLRTSTLQINLDANGNPPAPALLMFDLNGDVQTDAETSLVLGLLPELRVHSAFSTPADNGTAFQFPWSTGAQLSIDLAAAGIPVTTGDLIRVQGVYFHPLSQYSPGLMVTNEVWFGGVGTDRILVSTTGDNPENADRSEGFFKVQWLSGPDIVNVKLDLGNSESNAGDLNNAEFDTIVPNMSDQFAAGNGGGGPGCQGTYRNASDILTGLVYDSTVNSNPNLGSAICDYYAEQGLMWDSGFIGIDPSGGGDWQALEFNFTDFGLDGAGNPAAGPETFEFDCDADGMNGSDGSFFQGMIVRVTLSDATVFEAELLPDAENSKRSFIGW